jgi:hypothetical protein
MSYRSENCEHLPDVKSIGYAMAFLRLLFGMGTLPPESESGPEDFFTFTYNSIFRGERDYITLCGVKFIRPDFSSKYTTEEQLKGNVVLKKLRQNALNAARKYQESQNLIMAAFETFLPLYTSVNPIELYMRILQSSDLNCLRCSIKPQVIAQICPLYISFDFEKTMTDLMALTVISPHSFRDYLMMVHQKCDGNIARRFRAIVNRCILDAMEFTTLNDFFLQNCGDLWRIVQNK